MAATHSALAAANRLAELVPQLSTSLAAHDIAAQIIDHTCEAHHIADGLALGDISGSAARVLITDAADNIAWNARQLKLQMPPHANRPDIIAAAHDCAAAVDKLAADVARAHPANQLSLLTG